MNRKKNGQINLTVHYGNYGKIPRNHKNISSKELKKLKITKFCLLFAIFLTCVIAVRILFVNFGELLFVDKKNDESNLEQEDVINPEIEEKSILFVVNTENPLDEEYVVNAVDFNNIKVDEVVLNSLNLMFDKAKNDGVNITFLNGYISTQEQDLLYQKEVENLVSQGYSKVMANAKAALNVSKANESEMQTGLCLEIEYKIESDPQSDILENETDENVKNFLESAEYAWLEKNAYDYGFVFRYPTDKTKITGVSGCENILRYVGNDDAAQMKSLNFCLEEYIEHLSEENTNK